MQDGFHPTEHEGDNRLSLLRSVARLQCDADNFIAGTMVRLRPLRECVDSGPWKSKSGRYRGRAASQIRSYGGIQTAATRGAKDG